MSSQTESLATERGRLPGDLQHPDVVWYYRERLRRFAPRRVHPTRPSQVIVMFDPVMAFRLLGGDPDREGRFDNALVTTPRSKFNPSTHGR